MGSRSSFATPVSATVSCEDGIERKFQSLDDLLAYENPARAAVRTFEIYGRTREPDRSITITLGRRAGGRTALSISGEEQEVTVTKTRILDTFSGMRAWYSPAATIDLYIFWSVIFATLMLVLQFMAPSTVSTRPGHSFAEAVRALGSTLLVLGPMIFGFFFDFTVIFHSLQDNPVFQNYRDQHEQRVFTRFIC